MKGYSIKKGDLVKIIDRNDYYPDMIAIFYEWGIDDRSEPCFSIIPIKYENDQIIIDRDGIARDFRVRYNLITGLGE